MNLGELLAGSRKRTGSAAAQGMKGAWNALKTLVTRRGLEPRTPCSKAPKKAMKNQQLQILRLAECGKTLQIVAGNCNPGAT